MSVFTEESPTNSVSIPKTGMNRNERVIGSHIDQNGRQNGGFVCCGHFSWVTLNTTQLQASIIGQ
jgi:hypothetical protein